MPLYRFIIYLYSSVSNENLLKNIVVRFDT